MRLVYQHDDARSGVDVGRDVVEFVNHRHHQPAVVAGQDTLHVPLALRHFHRADAVGFDIAEELLLQLVAVHQHQHRRLLPLHRLARGALGQAHRSRSRLAATVIMVSVLPLPWVCQISPRRFAGSCARATTFSTARV